MKNTKLELKFSDNKKTVEFNLFNNTVFYGLNGSGKTRILKTVIALQQLTVENRYNDINTLIKDLNLEYIKLNNVQYEELFVAGKRKLTDKNKQVIKFIREESNAITYYISLFKDITPFAMNYIPSIIHRRVVSFNKFGQKLLENIDQIDISYDEFDSFLEQGRILSDYIIRMTNRRSTPTRDNMIKTEVQNSIISRIDNLKDVEIYINDSFIKNSREFEYQTEQKHELIESEKNNITSALKDISVKFIPAYHESEEETFFEVLNSLRNVNDTILSSFWKIGVKK